MRPVAEKTVSGVGGDHLLPGWSQFTIHIYICVIHIYTYIYMSIGICIESSFQTMIPLDGFQLQQLRSALA